MNATRATGLSPLFPYMFLVFRQGIRYREFRDCSRSDDGMWSIQNRCSSALLLRSERLTGRTQRMMVPFWPVVGDQSVKERGGRTDNTTTRNHTRPPTRMPPTLWSLSSSPHEKAASPFALIRCRCVVPAHTYGWCRGLSLCKSSSLSKGLPNSVCGEDDETLQR